MLSWQYCVRLASWDLTVFCVSVAQWRWLRKKVQCALWCARDQCQLSVLDVTLNTNTVHEEGKKIALIARGGGGGGGGGSGGGGGGVFSRKHTVCREAGPYRKALLANRQSTEHKLKHTTMNIETS
ncbi:hypothetical protein M0804_007051 [Polistes exclamans]|nr:hypothetical protein M0804_007051 [Polistes exclamans]